MDIKEITKSIVLGLKDKFNIPVYTRDTTEGHEKPCFFVDLSLDNLSRNNKSIDSYTVQVEINYVATRRDDVAFYNIIEQVKEMYKRYVRVGTRTLHISNFDYDYAGDDKEQLVFTLIIDFFDRDIVVDTDELMGDVDLTIEGDKRG